VVAAVAAVAEEQVALTVAGAAAFAADGVVDDGLARAGDGGRRVDGVL
jgi:2-oxoglutarate dehydrogenase complex dehydrogenase (E1) component-like enzyme